MSNWFESNATKSIIINTLLVATATWATFEFVFDKNKINLYEARIGKTEAEAKEVEARNSVLATRVEYLTIENQKLLSWLESTPNSIPYYEKEITSLKEKLKIAAQKTESSPQNTPSADNPSLYYSNSEKLESSTSFFDKETNIVFGAPKINYGDTADIILTLPDGEKIKAKDAVPGETWRFNKKGKEYMLILDSVDWATQSYKSSVTEVPSDIQ